MLNENDYHDDDSHSQDPAVRLKQQKYKTWLYVGLLAVCFYVLFYATLIRMKSNTIGISEITPDNFDKLRAGHGQTLSCPCSTTVISYKDFVSTNMTMYPICSSAFVSKEWIEGLYFSNASSYPTSDFRMVAYSQFELLSRFCSLSREMASQIQTAVRNLELVTIELLSEIQVRLEINGIIEFQKSSAANRIISFMDYWRTTSQGIGFVSALGTNWVLVILDDTNGIITKTGGYSARTGADGVDQLCDRSNIIIPATLYLPLVHSVIDNNVGILNPLRVATRVKGFSMGCTPLEGLLASTLDCLYDGQCLQLLLNSFPNLNQTNPIWNNSILSSPFKNISVLNYFENLFVSNWSSNINYSAYFHKCSPSICTYTTIDRTALSHAITLFISLYGALILILRLVASCSIDIVFKFKVYPNRPNINMSKMGQSIKRLNLFKNVNDRTENSIKQQMCITRIYLVLLFGSVCTLCLYTSLKSEIVTITVSSPSIVTYRSLESKYSTALRCPCTNKTILYESFVSFSPVFHQICSSGLIGSDWTMLLRYSLPSSDNDWRAQAPPQFQVLSDLCSLANKTIDDALNRFYSQAFVTSTVMNEVAFNKQLNTSLNQFYQSTLYNFDLIKNLLQLVMRADQLYTGSFVANWNTDITDMVATVVTNQTTNSQTAYMQILLHGIQEANSTLFTCFCAMNPNCKAPTAFYDSVLNYDTNITVNMILDILGWNRGCLSMDSLLLSTLQCFYADANSDCFAFILSHLLKIKFNYELMGPLTLDIHPLIYNPTQTRYSPNTTISVIIKELMLETWNPSLSYENFYQSCSPIYCSYSERVRQQTFLEIIVILVSMIGGVVVSLRFLTPHFVRFTWKVLNLFVKKPRQVERVHRRLIDRLRTIVQNVINSLYATMTELNIFKARDFGGNCDRVTLKRNGQWATRLYIILFITSLTIFISYTIVQPRAVTQSFNEPSFSFYNHLTEMYGDKLQCSCSQIASPYAQFVSIQPIFHSVCSSQFVSETWRMALLDGLVSNLTIYEERDYRRFLSAHLQYLQGLCQLSQTSVTNAINEFLTSLLITVEILPQNTFQNRLSALVEQTKSNAPILFSNLMFAKQSIFHGNALMTSYGTNFQYYSSLVRYTPYWICVQTEAKIYDDNCSCGLSPTCVTQANFIEQDSLKIVLIKGMKMGCTPSESFFASTLECFYDQLCLDLIQNYTNYKHSLTPLATATLTRFPQNTTISEFVEDLFIESWSTDINYPLYYQQCLPSICYYISVEKFNVFYIITLILGLQGGLSIVLKFICPKLIRILSKIYLERKQTTSVVSPGTLIKEPLRMTANTDIQPMNSTSQSGTMTYSQSFFTVISIGVLLVCTLVGVITFSIYYSRQDWTTNAPTVDSLSTTLSTAISTSSISTGSIYTLAIIQVSIDTPCSDSISDPKILTDINGDNRTDLIFCCENSRQVNVLLGHSNGSFERAISFSLEDNSQILQIRVGDINGDEQIDLILGSKTDQQYNVNLLYSNGNGTFQTQHMQSLAMNGFEIDSNSLENLIGSSFDLNVNDLNKDSKLDIIVVLGYRSRVFIFFGDDNGTFSSRLALPLTIFGNPSRLNVVDLNNDSYLDLIVLDIDALHIQIFFGDQNGRFQLQKWFFTVFGISDSNMLVGDFNNDGQPDMVFFNSRINTVYVSYRNSNGTFQSKEKTIMESYLSMSTVTALHLNDDGYLDIVIGTPLSDELYVLIGSDNGDFQTQIINSTELNTNYFGINTCQDVINMNIQSGNAYLLLNTRQCSMQ
ncbi:unnamed protein product [Adineta ricciae]|uniref:Uncharacterized protein n=1 Tax=Adineta ricciae TaxID=249248 RepID=A0A814DAC8_ADIRI|nr:unnamed protein product [Adineta ricciae]CAF0951736.1 unnamed protein product [Adineta ricciae]